MEGKKGATDIGLSEDGCPREIRDKEGSPPANVWPFGHMCWMENGLKVKQKKI
jgi:hypothetical protein